MQASNLSKLLGVNASYATFNREERNYAALLYHLLMRSDKALEAFLTLFGQPEPTNVNDIEIYVEYAHARDLWFEVKKLKDQRAINELYLRTIVTLLSYRMDVGADVDMDMDVASLLIRHLPIESSSSPIETMVSRLDDGTFILEFNKLFDKSKNASSQWIQMPGRWSRTMLDKLRYESPELWRRAVHLKWAFNAKADMVIHTGENSALCVEMKFESPESNYTAHWLDTPEAREDKANRHVMGQLRLQQIILRGLLGYTTSFALISKPDASKRGAKAKRRRTGDSDRSQGDQTIKIEHRSWKQVFEALVNADGSLIGGSRGRFVSALIKTASQD